MPDPRRVQTPDGAIHEFPPDATDAEISAALNGATQASTSQKPPDAEPSTWDKLKSIGMAIGDAEKAMAYKATDALPAIGATVGSIVGGIGGTVGGVGVGGVPGSIGGAAVGGAGGEAAKQLLNRAAGRGGPSSATQAATDIGKEGAVQGVIQGVGEGVGRVAGPILKWAGGRLMQSALGTGAIGLDVAKQAAKKGELPKVVQTLLDEGVNVTPGGIDKLQTILGETNQAVKNAIAPMTGQIDRPVVAMRAYSAAKKMTEQTNPGADLRALGSEVEEFLNPVINKGPLSPQEAQAMKVGTYKKIGDKYGTPAELNPAQVQAQMAFARGLKEEIERLATAQGRGNVKVLNAREGKILEALEATGRKVAQARGVNPIGFAFVAHAPMTFLAALIDRSPAAKSMLARGLYNSAATATGVSPTLLRATVAAIGSAQDEEPNGP